MKKKFPEIGLKDEWPWDSYAVLNPVVEWSKLTSETTENVGLGGQIPLRILILLCLTLCFPLMEKV
jgi:hypothetical protein